MLVLVYINPLTLSLSKGNPLKEMKTMRYGLFLHCLLTTTIMCAHDLVRVRDVDPTIYQDMPYKTTDNFTKKAVPTVFDCFDDAAQSDYMPLPKDVLERRELLKSIMKKLWLYVVAERMVAF